MKTAGLDGFIRKSKRVDHIMSEDDDLIESLENRRNAVREAIKRITQLAPDSDEQLAHDRKQRIKKLMIIRRQLNESIERLIFSKPDT